MGRTGIRFFGHYVLVVALLMGVLFFLLPGQLERAEVQTLRTHLTAEARLILDNTTHTDLSPDELQQATARWAQTTGTTVNLLVIGLDAEGQHTALYGGEELLYRPEVEQALVKGTGFDIDQDKRAHAAVATASSAGDMVVVHLSLPYESTASRLRLTLLWATLIQIGAGALVSFLIGRDTRLRLRHFTEAAQRLIAGDLRARLVPRGRNEFTTLYQTFNAMADEFEGRVTTMARQRDEQAAVLEYMGDAVLILDGPGRVQLVNHAATALLGAERASIVGRSFTQVVRDHQLVELWQKSQQEEREEEAGLDISHLGLFVRAIVTPLESGRSPRCMILIQDMTKMRRLETVRRDFISNASHDLRTPLASMKAVVDTLRGGALDDPFATQHFLDRLDTEVEDMTQIVQELLELSRLESGRVPLRREPTAVQSLVEPPVERLRPQAERAQLSLEMRIAEDLPEVVADAERVKQVVTNLVHNAIKFTLPKGHVTVSADAKGGDVLIAVSDTGVGIPAEDVPRVFERFYKADRARSGGGTGLGLAIARHVVEAHGGKIWVESVEGQGSTFTFSLPAVKPSRDAGGGANEESRP